MASIHPASSTVLYSACISNSAKRLLHIVFTLLLVELPLLLSGRILVLLILGDQVIHVALCFCKLHLVHSFPGVPMQEGLASEHGCEELGDALEHFLDSGRIASESDCHLQSLRRDIADACLDVVWNPLDEVAGILVLDIQHLLIHLLGRHAATEQGGCSQIADIAGVSSTHQDFRIEHLLSQLWDGQRTVLLRSARRQRCEPRHEEVETWEGDQVHCNLTKVTVKLARETQARRHTAHGGDDEMV